jgi:hypothetical protein
MMNQHIDEILIEQRRRELDRISPHTIEAIDARQHRESVRHAIASALVRLGTTLDRDAGVREALAR